MTIYTQIEVDGTVYSDSTELRVKKSTGENNSSSRATFTLDNTNGRNKAAFVVGDDVEISIGQVPTNGLLGYWSFDNDANDQSVAGNDGTVTNAVQVGGIINNAYKYDGDGDFIDLGDVDALDVGSDDFTVSVWFKSSNTSGGGAANTFIVGKGASGSIRYTLAMQVGTGVDGLVDFNIDDDTSAKSLKSTAALNDGSWHHIVAMRDGTNTRLFVDGAEDANSPLAIGAYGTLSSADTFRFGADKNGNNEFDGVIDECGVWNRALSSAEIVDLYNSGSGRTMAKEFAGIVEEIKYAGKGSNRERIDVMSRDHTARLQKITVQPEVYTDQTASFMANDLMTKYGPADITLNNLDSTTKTLPRMVFKQDTLFDALIDLAKFAGFVVYVDTNKDLHFEQRATVSSKVTLDNSNVLKSSFVTDIEQVRNFIKVYGSRQLAKVPQESFTADGAGSVFTLGNKPHNTQVKASGVEQKGGIFQGTEAAVSGPEYLVNFHDKQIVFQSGTDIGYSSIPGSLDPVTIDYFANKPIIKFARDEASANLYGERTLVINDSNIEDAETAREIAINQLKLKKDPFVEGKVDVYGVANVQPSRLVSVNLPDQDQANKSYEVIEAVYSINKMNALTDQVLTLRLNQRIANIHDVLKELVNRINAMESGNIDSSDVITRMEYAAETVGLKIEDWRVSTNNIRASFILNHSINGQLGSPEVAVNGSQVILGDHRSALVVQESGT